MSEVANEILNQEAATAPVPTPAPQKDERVSSKMEILIRREQAALHKEKQAKEQIAQAQGMLQKIQEFESARSNPKKAMELLGLNYDELTKSVLSDGQIPPEVEIKKLKEEFSGYKQQQEDAEKRRAEELKVQAQAQETEATKNFKSEIRTYVTDNQARYELINFDDRIDEVYDLIDAHFERTRDPQTGVGKIMNIKEAADKIEEYYEKREIEKKKLSKLQTLWGAVPKASLAQAVKQEVANRQKPETLTNSMSATLTKSNRPHEEQRIAEIVARFKASKGL